MHVLHCASIRHQVAAAVATTATDAFTNDSSTGAHVRGVCSARTCARGADTVRKATEMEAWQVEEARDGTFKQGTQAQLGERITSI